MPIPAVDAWLASAVAFGRIARGGVGATMAHYTRVQGLTDFPTEARAVAKAARDVGLHIALAVHCRDLNPLVYDPHQALLAALSPAARACVRAGGHGRGGRRRYRGSRGHRPIWSCGRAMVQRRDAAADRHGGGAER